MNNRAGIQDFGPVYQETDVSRFPVEPWNALSNLVFLAIVIYWAIRVYPQIRQHRFISLTLPILLVGFIGGTVYHATRSHPVWLFLDFMPILFLTLMTSIYFWRKITGNWLIIVGTILLPFLIRGLLSEVFTISPQLRISIGYSTLAVAILLPVFYYALVKRSDDFQYIIYAMLSFALAVSFRYLDGSIESAFLSMGTHWLWHLFGGFSTHFLIAYIYHDDLATRDIVAPRPFLTSLPENN